jgi:hypothetical protein
MKNLKLLFIALSIILFATLSFAGEQANTSTLNLTILNRSNDTLTLTNITDVKPGNTFVLETSDTIAPGSSLTIAGTAMSTYDLFGTLHFKDASGNDNTFVIIVNRKIKVGQPVLGFSKTNPKFITTITSKTFNNEGDGNSLAYIAASVKIESKTSQFRPL